MHVTPSELRVTRHADLLLRFALLGPAALVLVEVPPTGTAGTSLEAPCLDPHWGIVLDGRFELECEDTVTALPAGSAYHVPPDGPEHRFRSEGRGLLCGFVPFDAVRADFLPLDAAPADGKAIARGVMERTPPIVLGAGVSPVPIGKGAIEAEAGEMGDWVFNCANMGRTSGFGSDWCDAAHWGLVLRGSIAITWEHDVEVLSAGDVYYCPPGPPGHHFETADGATILDFTPNSSFASGGRIAEWRTRRVGVQEPATAPR